MDDKGAISEFYSKQKFKKMKDLFVSQSLIKGFTDYKMGKECGLLFKAKYLDGVQTPPSDTQKLGQFFEYLSTGALPKGGEAPQCEMVYKGTPKEKPSADYERAILSSEIYHDLISNLGIEVISVGKYLSDPVNKSHGTIDIYAKWERQGEFNPNWNGEVYCLIDLKYTGLIDDKWNEFGWQVDSLPEKHGLMIQGVHYKSLAETTLGIADIPFYYFLFHSKNPDYVKIIEQKIDETRASEHRILVQRTREMILKEIETGFKAYPSLLKCKGCPLFDTCEAKTTLPIVEVVYY